MVFQIHTPSKALQPFVQCFLEADGRDSIHKGEYSLFPNGLSGIFFNFGNTGKIILKKEYETPSVSVFGQIDHHFVVTHRPGFYSLGVLLKPTVLSWLLHVDMSEFTNKALDGQLIRCDMNSLHHHMQESASVKDKIACAEQYLGKILLSNPQPITLVDHALHLIYQQKAPSIYQLSQHLKVSQRYLEDQFKRTVGLSPKTYSLIHRFKRMEHQLIKMSSINWQHMSFANEYYDQNHFIKDFKRFTGLTPSNYLLENFEMGKSYLKGASQIVALE